MRVSFDPAHDFSGTIGAFYSQTHTKFWIPPTYRHRPDGGHRALARGSHPSLANRSDLDADEPRNPKGHVAIRRALLQVPRPVHADARRAPVLALAGCRLHGRRLHELRPRRRATPQHNSQTGTDPKIGLSYQANEDTMVYASASKGFRAGGAQAYAPFCALAGLPVTDITQLKSDTLWSYELGTKVQLPNPGLLISAAAFHIDWKNLQQQGRAALRLVFRHQRRSRDHQRRRTRDRRSSVKSLAIALWRRLRRHEDHRSGRARPIGYRPAGGLTHSRQPLPGTSRSAAFTRSRSRARSTASSRPTTATRATVYRCSTADSVASRWGPPFRW
jgi:outer membrane receptor protein involved in Fe transport